MFLKTYDDFFNFYPRGYAVSAWIKMPAKTGPWGAYVSKQGANPQRGFILTHNGAGQPVHTLRQSFNDLGSNTDADNNDWHLVTGTYDGVTKEGKVYVDGLWRLICTMVLRPPCVMFSPRRIRTTGTA